MFKTSLTAILIALVAFLSACNFNHNDVTPKGDITQLRTETSRTTEPEVSLVNGRVKFRDMESFKSVMATLVNTNKAGLQNWETTLGHKSLRNLYEVIDSNPDGNTSTEQLFESEALLFVPDNRFATVLNEEGVFQIGKFIHKITQHEEYIIVDGDENTLRSQAWNAPNVKKSTIDFTYTKGQSDTKGGRMEGGSFIGWREEEIYSDIYGRTLPTTWNGRPTRMKASQWNVSYVAYASAGVRTKYHYRTTLAGWQPCDASQISYEADALAAGYGVGASGIYTGRSGSEVRYDDNIADRTLYHEVGAGIVIFIAYMNSTHRVTYKGATAQTYL